MNYDTVLPPRIRATLLHKPRRLKLWHKIAIGLVLLLGLRHLNTVPQRELYSEWTDNGTYLYPKNPPEHHSHRVYTAETLFGSSYRVQNDGIDTRSQSKIWEDFVPKRR